MSRILVALSLLALPGAAFAQSNTTSAGPTATSATSGQQQAESGQPPKRIRDITLTAGQTCPKAENDEVVVCRTLEDPYRIPKPLRDEHPIAPQNQSWVNRAATMDEVGRKAGGLPDTCSPVGSGGATGCTAQMLRQWTAEQKAKRRGEPVDDSGKP
ncbi:MAG: hypothetical protein V4475_01025 [Pseudomonadota bacterium]